MSIEAARGTAPMASPRERMLAVAEWHFERAINPNLPAAERGRHERIADAITLRDYRRSNGNVKAAA